MEATVNAPVEKVWAYWSAPEHITKWNAASEDCATARVQKTTCAQAVNSSTRREAKDGSLALTSEVFTMKRKQMS